MTPHGRGARNSNYLPLSYACGDTYKKISRAQNKKREYIKHVFEKKIIMSLRRKRLG